MMNIANEVRSWSNDTNRKVGAVITSSDYRILSTGYNGLPKGVELYKDKNMQTVHAEINAILYLNTHVHPDKIFIYGGYPCSQCAAAIIQKGINEVYAICNKPAKDSKWARSIGLGRDMLCDAGIDFTYYTI